MGGGAFKQSNRCLIHLPIDLSVHYHPFLQPLHPLLVADGGAEAGYFSLQLEATQSSGQVDTIYLSLA